MKLYFVVKVSKLCNLRCTYCCETPELANKARMSLENIEKMFVNIRDFIGESTPSGRHEIDFTWHGGEPFAQPIAYWESILELEDKIFGKEFVEESINNNIQTNLTLLNEKHLPLLRRKINLSFSYDVLNDRRVDAGGKPTNKVVEDKVAWLLKEGVQMVGIAVISRSNYHQVEKVADYFLKRGIVFRALNLDEAKDSLPAAAEAAVPFEAYLQFFKELYHLYEVREALDQGMHIEPLYTAMLQLKKWEEGEPFTEAHLAEQEPVLLINTNGDIYSAGDAYHAEFCYGNIFNQTIDDWLASEGRAKKIERSKERLNKVCSQCVFFQKGCSGYWVSQATDEEYREFEKQAGCYYKFLSTFIMQDTPIKKAAN